MKKDVNEKIKKNIEMINISNNLLKQIDNKINNISDENKKNEYLSFKRILLNIKILSNLQNLVLKPNNDDNYLKNEIKKFLNYLNKVNYEFYLNYFKTNLNKNIVDFYLKNERNGNIKDNLLLCMILNVNIENHIDYISIFEDNGEKNITKLEILNTILNYIVENNNNVIDKIYIDLNNLENQIDIDEMYDNLDYIAYVSDYLINLINTNYDKIQYTLNEIDKNDNKYDTLFGLEAKIFNLYLYLKINEIVTNKSRTFTINDIAEYINKLNEYNKIEYTFLIDEYTDKGLSKNFDLKL